MRIPCGQCKVYASRDWLAAGWAPFFFFCCTARCAGHMWRSQSAFVHLNLPYTRPGLVSTVLSSATAAVSMASPAGPGHLMTVFARDSEPGSAETVADLSHHLVRLFRNGSGGRTNCVSDKPAYADGTADQRCYFCRSWCALARPVHLYASSSFGTWNVPRCFRSQISSSMRLGPSSRSLSKRHRALEAPILAGYCPC